MVRADFERWQKAFKFTSPSKMRCWLHNGRFFSYFVIVNVGFWKKIIRVSFRAFSCERKTNPGQNLTRPLCEWTSWLELIMLTFIMQCPSILMRKFVQLPFQNASRKLQICSRRSHTLSDSRRHADLINASAQSFVEHVEMRIPSLSAFLSSIDFN